MHWRLPFVPYPSAKPGFWSPVTSTLNWCEEDYYATIYAAEIVNALTNLLFIWLGIKGIVSCRRNGHDSIFTLAYVGYLLVGTGSFLFHSTLKYPMQLVDELSMIYTTCLMCYASFSFAKSQAVRLLLAAFLVLLAVFITLYYHYLQDPSFHQNAYAVLTAVVVARSIYSMEATLRPELRRSTERDRLARAKKGLPVPSSEAQLFENTRDLQTLKEMWAMVSYGLGLFVAGVVIWHLDNHFCTTLRGWRRLVGLPWGILLEGHGWWHLMTGVGAYFYIVWGIWLRHCLNGRQEAYNFVWPHFWNFPELVLRKTPSHRAACQGARQDRKSH